MTKDRRILVYILGSMVIVTLGGYGLALPEVTAVGAICSIINAVGLLAKSTAYEIETK